MLKAGYAHGVIMTALGFEIDEDIICSCCFEKLIKASEFKELIMLSTILQVVAEDDLCSKCGFSYGREAARKAAKNLIEGRTKWK